MKAWKIILIVIAIVFVLVGGVSWYLMNNMDRMATESFEEGGQELLGVPVSVDSVEIKVLAGKARVTGLRIANPAGYSPVPALTFGVIEVDIDLGSIDEKVMVIENILIRDPVVSYEIDENGKANIDLLQERIDEATPSSAHGSSLMIIERLDIKGGTIIASAASKTDQQLEFDFPVLFMTDLGDPDGAPPEQIGAEITEALMERVNTAAKKAGVDSLVDAQKERLIEKAGDKLKDLLKKRD